MLAVLNELTQMSQARLLGLGILLNDRNDRVNNRPLVIETTLMAKTYERISISKVEQKALNRCQMQLVQTLFAGARLSSRLGGQTNSHSLVVLDSRESQVSRT